MWYSIADEATKSSTSGNGWRETIYTPWSGRGSKEVVSFESEQVDNDGHNGKQARINTNKTMQSLPPLYESASSSGLYVYITC